MELQAVIFDLDGVLVDSESVWDQARRGVVADNGGTWKPEATTAMMGMSSSEWSRYLHDELGVALEPTEINARVVARVLDAYHHDVPGWAGAGADPSGGLPRGWPLGLASSANRPVIDAVLEDHRPRSTALPRRSPATRWKRGKPAPDVYLAAARKLGVEGPRKRRRSRIRATACWSAGRPRTWS